MDCKHEVVLGVNKMMVQYLLEAVKLKNGVAIDTLDLFTYDCKKDALREAKDIATGVSPTSQALHGFTDIVVYECEGDEIGNCYNCEKIARFKVL